MWTILKKDKDQSIFGTYYRENQFTEAMKAEEVRKTNRISNRL